MAGWNDWTNASMHQETHEFKSRTSVCWTMIIQMKRMYADDMQMLEVIDLYDYVKGRVNFGVWQKATDKA